MKLVFPKEKSMFVVRARAARLKRPAGAIAIILLTGGKIARVAFYHPAEKGLSMATKGIPKSLEPFCDNGLTMAAKVTPKSLEPFCDNGLTMGGNWHPKTLEPFCDKGLTMGGNWVEVIAKNSPH